MYFDLTNYVIDDGDYKYSHKHRIFFNPRDAYGIDFGTFKVNELVFKIQIDDNITMIHMNVNDYDELESLLDYSRLNHVFIHTLLNSTFMYWTISVHFNDEKNIEHRFKVQLSCDQLESLISKSQDKAIVWIKLYGTPRCVYEDHEYVLRDLPPFWVHIFKYVKAYIHNKITLDDVFKEDECLNFDLFNRVKS